MEILSSIKRSSVVHLMMAITFFTSGLIINLFQCILYFGLRPFSKYLYRKINYYLCYSFYCQIVFMAEWWAGAELTLYIDKDEFEKYFAKEHAYLLMNHSYEIDWLMGWIVCDRINVLGNSKAYMKKSIQYIPTLGWAWKFAENIFLERNWEKDKNIIGKQIDELLAYPDPIWLLLYPEGTRFTEKKRDASQMFAKEKGLPILKHHLTPRTKGFIASIPHMRNKQIAIYDVHVIFHPEDRVKPSVTNILLGNKLRAHMYIKRISLDVVPEDDKGAAEWLHKFFEQKDRLTESFLQTHDMFATSDVPRANILKLERRYYSLINTVFWFIVVLVPMLYYLVKMFLSGSTFYLSMAVGIIALFYLLLYKTIGMSKINQDSSYGMSDSKKAK